MQARNVIAWLKLVGEMKHLEFRPWFVYLPAFSVLLGWILYSSHAKARWAIDKVAACLADVKALWGQETQSYARYPTHCNTAIHWFTRFTGFFSKSSRTRLQTVTSATPSARSEILVMHVTYISVGMFMHCHETSFHLPCFAICKIGRVKSLPSRWWHDHLGWTLPNNIRRRKHKGNDTKTRKHKPGDKPFAFEFAFKVQMIHCTSSEPTWKNVARSPNSRCMIPKEKWTSCEKWGYIKLLHIDDSYVSYLLVVPHEAVAEVSRRGRL